MNAKNFYEKEDCGNNDKYDITQMEEWYFGKEEMILFAERYYEYKESERQESDDISKKADKTTLILKEKNMLKEKYIAWLKYHQKYTAEQVLKEIITDLDYIQNEPETKA